MPNYVKLQPTIGGEIPHLDFTFRLGGTSANSLLMSEKDAGKAVKIIGDSQVDLCADGDEIHGQIQTVEPHQTAGGFRWGTVRAVSSPLLTGQVAAGATLAIGDEVVAAAQKPYGVVNNKQPYHERMLVKKAATANGLRLKVVAIVSGTGAEGSQVTLSKIFQ